MKAAAFVLCGLGLAQMAGDLLGLPLLKGLGAATAASPAPKVFTAVRGLETYSTAFFLEWTDRGGHPHSLHLTPEVYARIRGPYNRRNVYGAALSYGPVLASNPRTRPMFDDVIRHALGGNAPLLRELGVDPAEVALPVRLRLVPREGSRLEALPLVLEAPSP